MVALRTSWKKNLGFSRLQETAESNEHLSTDKAWNSDGFLRAPNKKTGRFWPQFCFGPEGNGAYFTPINGVIFSPQKTWMMICIIDCERINHNLSEDEGFESWQIRMICLQVGVVLLFFVCFFPMLLSISTLWQVSMNPSVLDVWEKFSADKQWHDLVVQALDGEAEDMEDGKLKI